MGQKGRSLFVNFLPLTNNIYKRSLKLRIVRFPPLELAITPRGI